MVPDQGVQLLSPALAKRPEQDRAAMIDAILIRQTFQAALGEYIQHRHPTLLEH